MGFGGLTFPQAKAIDVCFDLAIGRGGQALLVWLCYPFFRRSLTRTMEVSTASTPLFSALAFDRVSLTSMFEVGATFASWPTRTKLNADFRKLSGTWRFTLLFFAFAYLLAFPTWMSSVTGYQSRDIPYVTTPTDGSLMPVKGWYNPYAILVDGSRVGLLDDLPVHFAPVQYYYPNNPNFINFVQYSALVTCYNNPLMDQNIGSKIASAADSARTSGAVNAVNSTFVYYPTGEFPQEACSFTLPLKATSASQYLDSSVKSGSQTYDMAPLALTLIFNPPDSEWQYNVNEFHKYYAFGNLTLTPRCLSARPSRWYKHMPTNAYRDAVDLAEELREQLADHVQRMPADELKRLVERDEVGISIDTEEMVSARSEIRKAVKVHTLGRRRQQGEGSGALWQEP
ncbi:hypothetical protein LTR17_019638 [Elasticomyces elasticus]|nr:hypothetical protein LTR17_019638 [Elasticomyces elasticus]